MTTTPPVPAAPDNTGIDRELADVCQTSGDYLAGLIAAGTLDSVGTPGKLPGLLWPDADPDLVQDIWLTALTVGWRGAKLAANPKWTADGLDRLRQALTDAGYTAMGNLAARSAAVHRPTLVDEPLHLWEHPADTEQHTVRDGSHT